MGDYGMGRCGGLFCKIVREKIAKIATQRDRRAETSMGAWHRMASLDSMPFKIILKNKYPQEYDYP
jgi:hypothetical protein